MVNWKRVALYYGLACLFSWPLGLIVYLYRQQWVDGMGAVIAGGITTAILVGYMYGPALAAIIVQKCHVREGLIGPLGLKTGWSFWYLAAWLAPPLISLAALGVNLLMPGVTYAPAAEGMMAQYAATLSPEQLAQMKSSLDALPFSMLTMLILQGLAAGPTINALAAFGEELGWRGFLYKELQPLRFWPAALFTGLLWGVWHWPLIIQGHNYPQHPVEGLGLMVVWTMLLSPLMHLLRIKTRSMWSAAIYHGCINAFAGLPLVLTMGGNDLISGVTGASGFAVLLIVNLLIAVYLRFSSRSEPSAAIP